MSFATLTLSRRISLASRFSPFVVAVATLVVPLFIAARFWRERETMRATCDSSSYSTLHLLPPAPRAKSTSSPAPTGHPPPFSSLPLPQVTLQGRLQRRRRSRMSRGWRRRGRRGAWWRDPRGGWRGRRAWRSVGPAGARTLNQSSALRANRRDQEERAARTFPSSTLLATP